MHYRTHESRMPSSVFKGPFPVFSGNFDGELAPYFLPLFHVVIPTLHQRHHRCGLLLYKQYTFLAVHSSLKVQKNANFLASILNFVLIHFYLCMNIKVLYKYFWIGPLWGEVELFRVVLRLRGIKNVLNLGLFNNT
jgi:hypothetical protein